MRDRKDCFVFAIDLDGKSAVEQFCLREDGTKTTLEELSKIFKVEDTVMIHLVLILLVTQTNHSRLNM